MVAMSIGGPSAGAATVDISGAWSGGGAFMLASGSRENAKCRVRYVAQSKTTFHVDAACATPSGRVNQTATVRMDGENSYVGRFVNSEYNVTGSIHITVSGNVQSVRLNSDAGSASLRLSR